jgi:hypothetical protein
MTTPTGCARTNENEKLDSPSTLNAPFFVNTTFPCRPTARVSPRTVNCPFKFSAFHDATYNYLKHDETTQFASPTESELVSLVSLGFKTLSSTANTMFGCVSASNIERTLLSIMKPPLASIFVTGTLIARLETRSVPSDCRSNLPVP